MEQDLDCGVAFLQSFSVVSAIAGYDKGRLQLDNLTLTYHETLTRHV